MPSERGSRVNDAERTKLDILETAATEFSEKGFDGARVDEIAARTRTSKRMLYYYFGGKKEIYTAVLERAYEKIRQAESRFDITGHSPESGLRKLVGDIFDIHVEDETFVRLLMSENLNRGTAIMTSRKIQDLNMPAIDILRELLGRGERAGVFRQGIDPIDLHMSIGSLCFFVISNRYTFGTAFKIDMQSDALIAARRRSIQHMILTFVRFGDPET